MSNGGETILNQIRRPFIMVTKEEAYTELTSRLGTLWAVITQSSEAWRRKTLTQAAAAKNVSFTLKQTIGVLTNLLKDRTLTDIATKTRLATTIEGLDLLLDATAGGSFGDALELREGFQRALSRILKEIIRETPAKAPAVKLLDKVAA